MINRRGIFILIGIILAAILLWIATRQWLLPLLPAQNTSLEDIKTLTDIIFGVITTLCTVATLYVLLTRDGKPQTPASPQPIDSNSRRILLDLVEEFWVKGILEKSLYGAALLDLGIKEDPGVLDYPWAIRREANKDPLPPGKPMLEIFKEIGLGRSLLILGAPGSGKTTMLLELARQLIERARQDDSEPVPIVFNLSSWTEKQSLEEWLTAELNSFYSVSKKLAPAWAAGEGMLLLLDGLDEVKTEYQDKCVSAINSFRTNHGLVSIALCSRSEEYAELDTKLAFNGAIEIQPLTSEQVTTYFNHLGPQMNGVRQVLQKDTVLSWMAQSPLFLSIMTLAYRDTLAADILTSDDPTVQRKHLFDTYIARMFTRPERSKDTRFEGSDVLRWLSWLAKKMIAHNQVPYLIERMQPDWLSAKRQQIAYKWLSGLLGGLLFGLIGGLIGGLLFGLIFGLNTKTVDRTTHPGQRLRFSFKNFILVSLTIVLVVGLVFVLVGGLLVGLVFGLLGGLVVGLVFVLVVGLVGGLSSGQIEETSYPNQNIILSARNFLITFFIFGLVGGLLIGLGGGLVFGLALELEVGPGDVLFFGLIFGPIFGLFFGGGISVVQHYVLRYYLAFKNDDLPWPLVPFLDYAADLILLRKIGGGYIFVHRLIMDHFATMKT